MNNESQIENNKVQLSGRIIKQCEFSHEVYGEGFYQFSLSVERLSDTADILPVTISERLIDRSLLTPGSLVSIQGQLRSYNNYSEKKNRLVLTIFAREVLLLEQSQQKDVNLIQINGYLCKKPIYRTTPFGREIADLLLAVNRAYNKSDYLPCICWGRNAKFAGSLAIGSPISISGRIQSRQYQKKLGDETEIKTAYEVSVTKIETPPSDPQSLELS